VGTSWADVTPTPSVSIPLAIAPTGTTILHGGDSQQFTASGGTTANYTWSLSTGAFGSINTTEGTQVTFTAATVVGTVTLTVTNGAEQVSATINITATDAPLVKEVEEVWYQNNRKYLFE